MQAAVIKKGCIGASRPVKPSAGACKCNTSHLRRCVTTRVAEEVEIAASSNGAYTASSGAQEASGFDFDELSEVIRMVQSTDIVELELKSKKFTLAVRKKEALAVEPIQYIPAPMPVPQYHAAAPASAPQPAAAPPPPPAPVAPAPAAPRPAPAAAPAVVEGVEVLSPMAGTVYRSPAPGEPPFVKEGDVVKKGQTVCLIEAMKLMNEIEAEVGGTLVRFIADNGSAVSPGQALFLIRP